MFGFTRDMLYLLEQKRPDYLFCAFDLPGKTFRHAMYEPVQDSAGGNARGPGAADSGRSAA